MTPDTAQLGLDLAAAIEHLVTEYPTDDLDASPVVHLTLTHRGEQLGAVHLQRGHVEWLTSLMEAESATTRNAHPGQSGQCAHCQGTGSTTTGE
jgi:hypothetical protein